VYFDFFNVFVLYITVLNILYQIPTKIPQQLGLIPFEFDPVKPQFVLPMFYPSHKKSPHISVKA
jgi:hypothetical protein